VFLDERGQRINGQWTGSPALIEHDILTGSNPDGTVAAGLTCADWTSAAANVSAQVGHSDGMGPNHSTARESVADFTRVSTSFVVHHVSGLRTPIFKV
jgi:hypothetical protein